jgi:thiol-disulfide isomerase/thioredoxin
MENNPHSTRPDLEQFAADAVEELVRSGEFAAYSGKLPPGVRAKLERSKIRIDDEAVLEDIFAERMIALTRNDYVEEIADDTVSQKIVNASHHRPVLVYVSSDYCRPCNHILPVVYQVAEKYRDALSVVKINISKSVGFRESFLGPIQMTPAFLFFRNGDVVPASGPLGRLLGQKALITNTRLALEKRIDSIIGGD